LNFAVSPSKISFLPHIFPFITCESLIQVNLPPSADYAILVDVLISDLFGDTLVATKLFVDFVCPDTDLDFHYTSFDKDVLVRYPFHQAAVKFLSFVIEVK
jgi:hypothetical protein